MANVRVALRVRPLSRRENAEGARIIVNVDEKIARIRNIKLDCKPDGCGDTRERLLEFGFDYCYWSVDPEDPKYASQEVVFQDLGTTVLSEAMKGYNVCLFAYGQTGSGKTYTMMGTPASIGLTPRICQGLFHYNDGSPGTPSSSRIEVSFLEIYNERVRDLLHQSEQKKPYTLRVREHPEKGPYVQGLSQHVVTDYEQVVALLEEGMENRITAATHVHDASSRSHAIFTIQYTQAMLEDNLPSEIASKINLVDLAGSERASPNYCKDRLTEGSNINRSLVTLGIVISALAQNSQMNSSCQSINSILSDGDSGISGSPTGSSATGSRRQPFVPYRDSVLTWLLKDSLGGNSKTIMIATVSPSSSSYNETMNTLRYASNAKNIINKPRVNEDANVKLIRELREEINRLKTMLRNFEVRTMSPSFSEERDGNLTELVLQNELKIEQLTKDWTDKWTDKADFMEQYNVDINEGKARVTIDSCLPHLIAMDDDILSTGVVIYYLREGTTNIGSDDQDIVLQGENIQQEHCVIENKLGVVELRPFLEALCTVNGQEVKDVFRLSQGAIIILGKSHRFRFNHPAEAAVLRQMRSDSQASFVSDCSLDWLDLSGDFSSSSKGNSLILNTRNSKPPSEEYQQGLRELEATYRKQIEEQQQYVENLKSQIQTAQVKGEKELEHEQSVINQQIQENQQWLLKEKERVSALCQQKRESSSQTEAKTYVEAEVQNCVQTDIQPSLEEQEGKKLVQLELLRKCSLRRAERNIRRKRVKLQLERIVKKQKLLEAKKTLQQLQAACWLSDDVEKPTLLHVPKVQETSVSSTALHRSSSSPSGFSFYRRRSLPWPLQTLPNSYGVILKRKCKSELVHSTKTDEVRKPLRSVTIGCLPNSFGNPGSNGQLESNTSTIGTNNLQFIEEQRIDLLIKQISTGAALLSSNPQMSKKRQKMDKPRGGSKGSFNNFTAEQPKRSLRATLTTGTKDTKLKPLKSPTPLSIGGTKKCTLQEKSKISLKSDIGKLPPQKSVKHTQKSPGQGKPPSGESMLKGKPARYNVASLKLNTPRKPSEEIKISSVGRISKVSNRCEENHSSDRNRISKERLGDRMKDDHTDSSDSESFYSIDSLSSAYASALTEQLKQEELQRQRNNIGQKDSDSEDSQMSQDSLAEKDKKKERPNKRRFNKYKTMGATSTTTSFTPDHNTFPLVTTGVVTTGLSKCFSLDSLADTEEVPEADSSEELPAEIYWKLQSPRNLILNEEDQNKENVAEAREDSGLDISNSFYLKMDLPPDYCNVTLHGRTECCPASPLNMSDGKSQTISLNSACNLSIQKESPKPNEKTKHGNALSPACAPKLDSLIREDEINHLLTNDIFKIEPELFTNQLEAQCIQFVQHACVSVPHTETQITPSNTCTIKGSETVHQENAHDFCLTDCKFLDERCSNDLDTTCYGQNNSPNSQASSPEMTVCKRRKPYSESEDEIATPVETSVTCTKNVCFRSEIQGKDEINDIILNPPVSSININVRQIEICEGKEIRSVPLTQQNDDHTTAKTIGENTNSAIPVSLHAQLENLNNQQQYISPIYQESISNLIKDDQLINCDSNAIQVLSQSQTSTVELDINANKDLKTEKQTNPVQETKISKNYNKGSVQKHDRCKHGKIVSTESRPVESQVHQSLSALEDDSHCASTNIPLLVQHSSLPQHKRSHTISYVPTSQHENTRDRYLHSQSQESVPRPSYEDTEILVKPSELARSLYCKSEKVSVVAIDNSTVTKGNDHVLSDDCINVAAEYNRLILHKNGEDRCSAAQNVSILDENYHMDDRAENSSSMNSIAVGPFSQTPDTMTCHISSSVSSKSEDLNRSDDATYINNYKAKEILSPNERTLPENHIFSKSDAESQYASAKTCLICKHKGSLGSQNATETNYPLCSECTSNTRQSNDEVLTKVHSKEIKLSREIDQAERAEDKIFKHNHLFTACEASKQVSVSSTINTQAPNSDLSTYDNTQSKILKEESPEMSFKTNLSCINENIPQKHAKLIKLKDTNINGGVSIFKHGDDFSNTKDSLSRDDHWKPCREPDRSKELGHTAECSSTVTPQQRDSSAYLVEHISGICVPLPYYEAKMLNKSFCKLKSKSKNLDQAIFSENIDRSKIILDSKQTGLNISSPSLSTVKDATNTDDVMEVEILLCPGINKCTEEEGMGNDPQNEDVTRSISYRTRDCYNVSQSPDANSCVPSKQYHGSRYVKELNSTTSSKNNIAKCYYLQSRSEETGKPLNSETCRDDRTQDDDHLVQQNTNKYENVLKTEEGECCKRTRDAPHHYESAPYTSEEKHTHLRFKDAHNSLNTSSFNSSKCHIKSDILQDATTHYLNENDLPRDQDKERTIINSIDSEVVTFSSDKTCSGCSTEDQIHQTTCHRSSSFDMCVDEVNRDHKPSVTADLSNSITNKKACKVECESKQLCDQNIPLLAYSNRVNDRVTGAVKDNDSSTSIGDKGNSGLEEKCLMATGVCGEYSSDLSESNDISSSDTDTSRYLVLKNVSGLHNNLVDAFTECESYSPMSKETSSQSAYFNEEMSSCTDSIATPSPEQPNGPDRMDSTETNMSEFSIDLPVVSITPTGVETSWSRSNFDEEIMTEHINSKVYAPHNVTDHTVHSDSTQTVQPPYPIMDHQDDPTITGNVFLEEGNKAFLTSTPSDEHCSNFLPELSCQAKQTDLVDNTEALHFSSSDINPFVHSWQQEDNPKPGWKNCTFNSASDVSCAKFREQADKLIRCSSVDEGLNAHISPFHSHLSSYANAKTVSSTISSLGRNDSRPDINSLDDSQELLSDESAVMCTRNRAEFTQISGLQSKFEDYSQLDEIIFLYTSESETCNEPVSGDHHTQIKQKHRKTSKHQRTHTAMSSSKQNRNVCQRPASWSSVQNMSLHLSQLLQETSELLGNLSKHNPENISVDATKMQSDPEEQMMKRSVRDSSTQTNVEKAIQTESQMVNNAPNHTREHKHFLSSSGINVIVKVLGTDSCTHISQDAGLTEQNNSKGSKTRTQSLPNLHEFEPCKQLEHVLYHSPQVRASTPFLTNLQEMSSTTFPFSSSKSSSISTNVNKCPEDMTHTAVNSPSSRVTDTTGTHTCYETTAMVDRASSPILTVKASTKFNHKFVPDIPLNSQNFVKILRNRKRKERELRDLQLNSSQTETDSDSNAGNEYEATRSRSLKETTRKKVSTAKFPRFVSEGCILRDTCSSFTNHSSSNSEVTSSGKSNDANNFTSMPPKKAPHPWEHLQSLQNLSLMSHQPLTNRDGQIPKQSLKENGSDQNDLGSFTITSGNSYIKNKIYPYSPSQMSGFGLHLQEDVLSVVESECNTDILLGQEPTFRTSHKPHSYALQELPMHNKFSNWSGVQCSASKNGMVSSSPDLNIRESPTKTEAFQEAHESRSQEIERLQRERAEVLSAIHLDMNPLPLTVQLAEAKLSYGIGETDALLRVIQTGKMDRQDTVSIRKQLYERHLKVIANLRKEREERLQSFKRSRSLSPQKQLSLSQTSLTSLRESDLPSRRREYLQQLRRDVVDNTRIQEPKSRAPQCPSEIEVMLKDYQKAREEAKTEIAKARDKLRERAEMERRRLQQGSLTKEDTKMKTLVSTSTLFTNSSLSLSSGPTSGYNSGVTATIGQGANLSSQETLSRCLDPSLGAERGRSVVRNCDFLTPTNISVADSKRTSCTSPLESLPGKIICSSQHDSLFQSTAFHYQELATRVQASAMAEVMTACSYDIKKLHNRQAAAGWIYQSTEKDVLVYYKAFSSPTKHGFIGTGVIKRSLNDVWCMVKDISTRRLYDQSMLTASVHERVSSNIQLVHVMTDTSLCYLKQPRDFCCIAVEFKQEKCYSLCFQSVYNESMPRPNKDTVRGELLPSAWILQPDTINGEAVTRVIYMLQVDLGAPAIPSRLLSVISKRQPLVIANLARFLSG
ncbi:stAR-related lipid transfer protein 9 [Rhinoderma darwinii]|uniref:stAR-related lipid transfer protein 9 n=1 Tax=Rhinoderma darwinii TaxID=43563 RepID=UPI003F67DB3A